MHHFCFLKAPYYYIFSLPLNYHTILATKANMPPSYPLLFLFLFIILFLLASGQPQTPYQCDESFSFMNSTFTKNITHCKKLRSLGAELGWKLYNTTAGKNHTINSSSAMVDIVFAAKPPSPAGWVAWGVNPGPDPKMVGTRAIIAVGQPDGAPPVVATYNVTADVKNGCKLENTSIEVGVSNVRSQYSGGSGMITVWATLTLPPAFNASRLNHVWQVGPRAAGLVPMMHAMKLENFDCAEKIDLMTGKSPDHIKERLRVSHGILSVIGWGFLLPIGVMVTRYFRTFPFKIEKYVTVHVSVQLAAYAIGTASWAMGLSLVTHSHHSKSFIGHRVIGILIFSLATLQITALWLKPIRKDKYRRYWNIYHHTLGYSLLALAVANIFKGLAILRPPVSWRWAYIGILCGLASMAFMLEVATWAKHFWMRPKTQKLDASIAQAQPSVELASGRSDIAVY